MRRHLPGEVSRFSGYRKAKPPGRALTYSRSASGRSVVYGWLEWS